MISRLWSYACRQPVRALLVAVPVVAVLGFGVAASGIFRITASSGHWAITEWFLQFSMRRSVVTQSLLSPHPPADLDREALVIQGATHYDTGCRPCHGSPGQRMPPITGAMTPHPPALPPRVGTWDARELFYIVKHGVKFTGMPAWPALQRNDEVWAMVAFLRRLPSLDEASYNRLVGGESPTAPALATTGMGGPPPPAIVDEQCANCHGVDGHGRVPTLPRLAGQRVAYLINAMDAYAAGHRHSGTMVPIAAALDPERRERVARYYAALPPAEGQQTTTGDAARGAEIARRGVPARDVPACDECHADEGVDEAYPRLHGQWQEYLANQLRLLQQRRRGGSEYVHLMHEFVEKLTDDDITDVTAHYASRRQQGAGDAPTRP